MTGEKMLLVVAAAVAADCKYYYYFYYYSCCHYVLRIKRKKYRVGEKGKWKRKRAQSGYKV